MRICNRKLAKRINDNEQLLRTLLARLSFCAITSAQYFEACKPIQDRINQDVSTLKNFGYDRRGRKVTA